MEKMKAFQNAILETLHYLFCAKKGLAFEKKKMWPNVPHSFCTIQIAWHEQDGTVLHRSSPPPTATGA